MSKNMVLATKPMKDPIEDAIEAVQQLNITNHLSCTECGATFKKEGNFKKHKTPIWK